MGALGLAAIAAALALIPAGTVSAEEEPLFGPMAPARISGGWALLDPVSGGEVKQIGELMFETTGAVATYRVTSDDPRLSGTATATGDWIGWYPPVLVAVSEASWLIEDDAGAWTGSSRGVASMRDDDPINADEQLVLDGSGTREGLTAYLILDAEAETFVGAIIPDEMPELPADWAQIYEPTGDGDPAGDD